MSEAYMDAVESSWECIEHVLDVVPPECTVIITSDHGGHDRTHGTNMPEDMTIPVMIRGKDFSVGANLGNVNIKDIAPTVTMLLDVDPDEEWEGKPIL